jgi:hypothetical protein
MNNVESYGINPAAMSYLVSIICSKILAAEFMHRQLATV